MTGSTIVFLVLRGVHIFSAIALMGGALFQRFALLPAVAELDDESHQRLRERLRPRWARVVMATSGLLLVSGLINFALTLSWFQFDRETSLGRMYHMLFGIKFLLALVVFFVAAMLAGRSAAGERLRQNLSFWLTINLVLAAAIVLLGGLLRIAPRSAKTAAMREAHPRPVVEQTEKPTTPFAAGKRIALAANSR